MLDTITNQVRQELRHELHITLEQEDEMHQAWHSYCDETINNLKNLQPQDDPYWLVNLNYDSEAGWLLMDLIDMTKKVPYKDKLVNMTTQAFMWLTQNPKDINLATYFRYA